MASRYLENTAANAALPDLESINIGELSVMMISEGTALGRCGLRGGLGYRWKGSLQSLYGVLFREFKLSRRD